MSAIGRSWMLGALAAAVAGLAGCATMPPQVPFVADAGPDHAPLTVFREHQFDNSAYDLQLRIDGKSVGLLSKKGGTLTAEVAPGAHRIAVQSEYDFRELVLPLTAQPGRAAFVDVTTRAAYLARLGSGVYGVPKDQAATTACNGKWCISLVSADEAKERSPK